MKICLMSHPVWVCGLKQGDAGPQAIVGRVTPCMGVWIETELHGEQITKERHTLYGCVD